MQGCEGRQLPTGRQEIISSILVPEYRTNERTNERHASSSSCADLCRSAQQPYAAPMQPAYAAPMQQTFAAPLQQIYAAPVQTYAAPVQQAHAPQCSRPMPLRCSRPMRRSAAGLCRSMNLCRSNADLHRSVQQPYANPMQQAYAAPMQKGLCRSNGPKPMPLQCTMALQCCSPMLQCSSPMLH